MPGMIDIRFSEKEAKPMIPCQMVLLVQVGGPAFACCRQLLTMQEMMATDSDLMGLVFSCQHR